MSTRPIGRPRSAAESWLDIKNLVHQKLLSALDTDTLKAINKERVRGVVTATVERLLVEQGIPMTLVERERMIEEVLDEVFGLGPLEPLLKDPTISDILVNGYDSVYIEREGRLVETAVRFRNQQHVRQIIEKIVSAVGRRLDESSPIVDARLKDGSRVAAIIPPLSLIGPTVSIRRFGKKLLSPDDLIKRESITPGMLRLLAACVEARQSIVICGGSGSGKTTLLNILSRYIPEEERVLTIEDVAELQLHQWHVVRLETRPPNIEGAGAVTQRDLVINSLRMRPDRIVVGESRGPEALDMLQAMNTGHDGSMTTIHANSTREAFARMETMVMMASQHLPDRVIRHQLASAINLVVHVARLMDGTRKVMSIAEVLGVHDDRVETQDLFIFERAGLAPSGRVLGRFRATGVRPVCLDRLKARGVEVPESIFEEVHEVRS
jgi:pilus assembly protein CpaF